MKQRRRIYYSPEQRSLIWDHWKRGETMNAIGRLFDRGHSSIFSVLGPTGGIRPPERKRSRLALSLAEREEISRGLISKLSLRAIARQLQRSPSTISREVQRNGGRTRYRATHSDQAVGIVPIVQSPVSLQAIASCVGLFLTNCDKTGRRNRLQGGSREHMRMKSAITCHMKRSIEVCLFKPVVC